MMKKIWIVAAAACCALAVSGAEPAPVVLLDNQYVEAGKIPDQAVYRLSTTVGHDVEIKLGEDRTKQLLWQVISYDPVQCRIKIDHEEKGVWPLKKEYAEVEVKGLVRGQQTLVLQCGNKKVTLLLNTL